MADNYDVWADKIITQKDSEDDLIVDTTSKAGDWRNWANMIGHICHDIEKLWEGQITLFKNKAKARPLMTIAYYQGLALAFQYGDILRFLGNKFGYATIDTTVQVCNVVQVIVHKVETGATDQKGLRIHPGFKSLTTGTIAPLSALEQTEFEAYMEELKPCGRRIEYFGGAAGNLILTFVVYYDPLILNSDGSLFLDPATNPINDAVLSYQNDYVNKKGQFNQSELRKRLFQIDGVEDLTYTHHRYDILGGTTYVDEVAEGGFLLDRLYEYNKAGSPEITYTSI